jgi:hypothetical protein
MYMYIYMCVCVGSMVIIPIIYCLNTKRSYFIYETKFVGRFAVFMARIWAREDGPCGMADF